MIRLTIIAILLAPPLYAAWWWYRGRWKDWPKRKDS